MPDFDRRIEAEYRRGYSWGVDVDGEGPGPGALFWLRLHQCQHANLPPDDRAQIAFSRGWLDAYRELMDLWLVLRVFGCTDDEVRYVFLRAWQERIEPWEKENSLFPVPPPRPIGWIRDDQWWAFMRRRSEPEARFLTVREAEDFLIRQHGVPDRFWRCHDAIDTTRAFFYIWEADERPVRLVTVWPENNCVYPVVLVPSIERNAADSGRRDRGLVVP